MQNSSVTVVIASNTYTLRIDDLKSLRDMPANDRDQLIALLEALKAQREKSERLVQDALAKKSDNHIAVRSAINKNQNTQSAERLGKGDVDAIMMRLIAEEKQQRKPSLRPATIYKLAAVIIVVIVLLSVFLNNFSLKYSLLMAKKKCLTWPLKEIRVSPISTTPYGLFNPP